MNSEELKTKSYGALRVVSRHVAIAFLFSLFTIHFSLSTVSAQDDDPAPPPLKILTKDERNRLETAPDTKARTKLVVDMMKTRIDAAEKLNTANDFDGLFRELGGFRALVDYSLAFLKKQNKDEGKTLDNYKRLEVSLRAASPRIETIRRELPLQYEEYVRELLKYIRDARQTVSEAMFSNTVLPSEGKK